MNEQIAISDNPAKSAGDNSNSKETSVSSKFKPSPKATYTTHDVKVGDANLNVTCVMDADGVTFIPTHTIRSNNESDYDNRLFFSTKEAQRMAMAILTQGTVADTRDDLKNILQMALREATDLCDELSEFIVSMNDSGKI